MFFVDLKKFLNISVKLSTIASITLSFVDSGMDVQVDRTHDMNFPIQEIMFCLSLAGNITIKLTGRQKPSF